MALKQCDFLSRSHFFTKIPKLLQTLTKNANFDQDLKIKMSQNIVFTLNRKIKLSRNPPKIPLKNLEIMKLPKLSCSKIEREIYSHT